jgi:hypothetical protein
MQSSILFANETTMREQRATNVGGAAHLNTDGCSVSDQQPSKAEHSVGTCPSRSVSVARCFSKQTALLIASEHNGLQIGFVPSV